MADISTIVGVDGSSYTIKDATARGLLNGHSVNKDVPANAVFTDTTYESKTAASGGTDESLVTTGEKYTWNNKGNGTITGIKMNGASKGTSGVVDLGTVITSHQDISGKMNSSLKGTANGVAELDANGKVPSSQLPSYVDDVLEYTAKADFPATGETGKIYVDKTTNLTWRWSGTAYVEISPSLALGETSSTAYRGDRGKTAYDHANAKGSAFASGLYKITTNAEGHVTAAAAVEKADITGLGIPGENTTYESKTAASGGTAVSLVTTGEKYTWNNKGTYSKPSGGIPDSDIASAATWNTKGTYSKPSGGIPASDLAQTYAGGVTAGGAASKAVSIPMGQVDSTSTSTVFTATVNGITELRDGILMWLKNGVVTSAAGFTININGLGAKPVYSSLHAATADTTTFNKSYTMLFIYNSSRVEGGCWDMVRGYDTNTTYTAVKLGFAFGSCDTAAATAAKTVEITNYALQAGGIVNIKFTNAVPAGATLNITSKGAKAIRYRGVNITAGVINAGDIATLFYDGTRYNLISVDTNHEYYIKPSGGIPDSDIASASTWNGKANASGALNLTLASGSWSSATPPTQSVTATGVTASNNIIVGLGSGITSTQFDAAAAAKLVCTAQSTNSITITAYGTKPTENIPINVIILG